MTPTTPGPTKRRRVRKWILGSTAALVVIVGAVLGPRLYNAFSLLQAGEAVDIGGRELFIHCEGTGSPTVLLEHGLGSNGHEWQAVQNDIAELTRVCWTSRAGMGFSDRAPDTTARTAQDAADDLSAALEAAQIGGPYVLVGHSFGGYVVRLFTNQHPDDVIGVVLVDSTHEDQPHRLHNSLSSEAWKELSIFFGSDNPENIDFTASADLVRATRDLGSRPLVVLEATEQSTDADDADITQATADEIDTAMADLWPELQADLALLSTAGTHQVVHGSGHFIQNDNPQAVTDAITRVISDVTEP